MADELESPTLGREQVETASQCATSGEAYPRGYHGALGMVQVLSFEGAGSGSTLDAICS